MKKFVISKNEFLTARAVRGYHHQYYTGYNKEGNPNFVNVLKNTFDKEKIYKLNSARNQVVDCLIEDIPSIISKYSIKNWVCVCVPRAKATEEYSKEQLYFKDAIKIAVRKISGVIDGTDYIKRKINTRTTHLKNVDNNDGSWPYQGITKETCIIDKNNIIGKNIILIDDIYTKTVNIDEDCIQALFDNGAKNVIYYSIGYTRRE